MANVTDLINRLCESCREDYDPAFNADPRLSETIAGDKFVDTCCYVRDEIRFLNNGRLIFVPQNEGKEYCRNYSVVCRKLVIVGGNKPGSFNPCGPDDPGQEYTGNNVITWQDRLKAAAKGASPNPPDAADGTSHDINVWSSSNNPNGNSGAHGGAGTAGGKGATGGNGRAAPDSITIIALEIEFASPLAHLTIDWDGQTGGEGGSGQGGGDGGDGMGGRDGQSDTTWPGTGCDRAPGHGGAGGAGGDGGEGGNGGIGGQAGHVFVITSHGNITGGGGFVNGQITYVNDGGSGGTGGNGGKGGRGGKGGKPGFKTSECDPANTGPDGADGFPPPLGGGGDNPGAPGAHGGAGAVEFHDIIPHACTDPIPLPVVVNAVVPNALCRGFASAATMDAAIQGENLGQVTAIDTSLAGVTATIKPTSTDTQLNVEFAMTGASALGNGNLTCKRVFGPDHVQANAVSVGRFEVLSVAPNTGARNNSVNVTITGTCFDPAAAMQNVNVNGTGVNALNVAVIDSTTVQCVFDIGNLAALGNRDVTVSIGGKSHTLLNAFNVTA